MKPTVNQLFKFIAKRWRAMPSNAQFQMDCNACGFKQPDLGMPEVYKDAMGLSGYVWRPACLERTGMMLVEYGNTIFLHPEHFPLPPDWVQQPKAS